MKTHTLILSAALVLGLASCGNSYNPKEIARIDEADELTAEQTDLALGWYEDALHREIAKLEAELKYQREFLESVRKKLSNEKFTAHAPEKVVAVERKKEADSLSKIESYETQLKALKSL